MSCFWTDFVNCREDCSDDCRAFFSDVEATSGDLHEFTGSFDIDTGILTLDFSSFDPVPTTAVITNGVRKNWLPAVTECDAGCCMQCSGDPSCADFTAIDTNYHFDELVDDINVEPFGEVLMTPAGGGTFQCAGGDILGVDEEDLTVAGMAAFHISTDVGTICDVRLVHQSCY